MCPHWFEGSNGGQLDVSGGDGLDTGGVELFSLHDESNTMSAAVTNLQSFGAITIRAPTNYHLDQPDKRLGEIADWACAGSLVLLII